MCSGSRRVERRWKFSRKTIDKEPFTNLTERVENVVYTARSTYYANKINDNPNILFSRQLVLCCKRNSCKDWPMTTSDNCPTILAITWLIFRKLTLSGVVFIIYQWETCIDECDRRARVNHVVYLHIYHRSCPPQLIRSPKWLGKLWRKTKSATFLPMGR